MNTALSQEQWEKIEPLLPKQDKRKGGRPRSDDRKVLNGILWILKTGCQWSALPKEYGSYVTCWRRLRDWEETGVWIKIWRKFLSDLDKEDKIYPSNSGLQLSSR